MLTPEEKLAHKAAARQRWKDRNPEKLAAWNAGNPEKLAAYSARYAAAHPEKAAARRVRFYAAHPNYDRLYVTMHQEEHRVNGAHWREANPEKARASAAKTAANHPDIRRNRRARRRARELNAPVIEKIDRASIFERDGGRCHICGDLVDPSKWDLDHVIPLKNPYGAPGEHSSRNVAVSHPSCNKRKGNRPLADVKRS